MDKKMMSVDEEIVYRKSSIVRNVMRAVAVKVFGFYLDDSGYEFLPGDQDRISQEFLNEAMIDGKKLFLLEAGKGDE